MENSEYIRSKFSIHKQLDSHKISQRTLSNHHRKSNMILVKCFLESGHPCQWGLFCGQSGKELPRWDPKPVRSGVDMWATKLSDKFKWILKNARQFPWKNMFWEDELFSFQLVRKKKYFSSKTRNLTLKCVSDSEPGWLNSSE